MKGLTKVAAPLTAEEEAAFNVRVSQVAMENMRLSNLVAHYRERIGQQANVIATLRAEVEFLAQFRPAPPAPAESPIQESLSL